MNKFFVCAVTMLLIGSWCAASCIQTTHVKAHGATKQYPCKIAGTNIESFEDSKSGSGKACKNCGCSSADHDNTQR